MSDHYDRYNGMENLLSTNLASLGTDCISRQAAIDALDTLAESYADDTDDDYFTGCYSGVNRSIDAIKTLPSAQPEPSDISEAYANAVLTWLMYYQIQSAQLKGRYTPYEVIGWVLNDWRKEHDNKK